MPKHTTLSSALQLSFLIPFIFLFSLNGISQTSKGGSFIQVKFESDFINAIETATVQYDDQGILSLGIREIDSLAQVFKLESIERVFPYNARFDKRHRAHGLHLWYRFSTSSSGFSAVSCASSFAKCTFIVNAESPLQKAFNDGFSEDRNAFLDVDDPQFDDQWSYENTGQTGGTADADIDLSSAWDIQAGQPEVVVAIIDGGMDVDHEDLGDNMWINEVERDGVFGVDDDGNGYVDDIFGYAFGDSRGTITPHYHGVHVGGTVGAVNNNGVGVSGVAGGTGTGDGIRMMSCAVFGSFATGGFDAAFVYAADNGAIIAQNSWGYTSPGVFEQSVLDAIDYFVENAGYDADGEPIGPMQGGLVVFAAGNDNSSSNYYPGFYDPVLSVASTDHNDVRSYFSNYGDWVDIAAPGSDILSTFPDDTYSSISGTSMACPHVSGIAALIVSEFSGTISPEEVWGRLTETADDIDDENPSFVGLLGGGRVNAYSSLQTDSGVPPEAIDDLSVSSTGSVDVTLAWTATGGNGSEGAASVYDIRYSTTTITETNFDSATPYAHSLSPAAAGTSEELLISGLDPTTTYYFAIKARNFFGNESDVSNVVDATTLDVSELSVSPDSLVVILDEGGATEVTLTLSNTGNETLTFSFPDFAPSGASVPSSKTLFEYLDLAKGAVDPRRGDPVLNGSGSDGEDGFGYSWIDSDEVGGPAFDWEDITSSGTAVSLSDDDYELVSIGFDFDFYDVTRSEVYISSNGFLSFNLSGATNYSNQSIPYTGTPNDFIAPFWDDLYPPGGGTVHYLAEADRFIVQYTDMDYFASSVGELTFQVILYPNGRMVFQYLDMRDRQGATIGIEGPSGVQGLQVAFNAEYVEDGLAVSINNVPPFVTDITPNIGSIVSGASEDITIAVDASDLSAGNYLSAIPLESNDPLNTSVEVPILLHINGAPVIEVSDESLDFGESFVSFQDSVLFSVMNTGSDTLTVSNVAFTCCFNSDTFEDTPWSLAAGDERSGYVYLDHDVAEVVDATMTITSNDTNSPEVTVDLTADVIEPPIALVTPDTIGHALLTGARVAEVITIDNSSGGSDLIFNVRTESRDVAGISRDRSGDVVRTEREPAEYFDHNLLDLTSDKQLSDIRELPYFESFEAGNFDDWTVDGFTGTREVTSDFASDGTYSFHLETTSSFTHLGGISQDFEEGSQPGEIRFSIRPGSVTSADAYFVLMSDGQESIFFFARNNGLFYVNADVGGSEEYEYSAEVWYDISFRDIDWEEKDFDFYVDGTLVMADVPMRNATGSDGFDKLYLYNFDVSEAWWDDIYLGSPISDWLTVDVLADTVEAGTSQDINATLDAAGLFGGLYERQITISTNDPNNASVVIPVGMEVTGAPDIVVSDDELDFGQVFVGETSEQDLVISNEGTDDLEITDLSIVNVDYTVSETSLTLSPGEQASVTLSYSPTEEASDDSELILTTNDSDESEYTINLLAEGVLPPEISISPDTLGQALFTGESATQSLTISNADGGSDLVWTLDYGYVGVSGLFEGSSDLGTNNTGEQVSSRLNEPTPLAIGDFEELPNSPQELTSLTIDLLEGIIYGQQNQGYGFYSYEISTQEWKELTSSPVYGGNNGGAAHIDGKIYTSYTGQSTLGIYDIETDSWETISSPLNTGIAASYGGYLYLVASSSFYRFDPEDQTFTTMADPTISFSLWGGLDYYEGFLYGHAGNGSTAFARYDIENNSWETLESLPGGAVLGAAIDPVDGQYYTYGSYGGSNFYVYDIEGESWSSTTIPYFNVNDGGLVHNNIVGVPGIYFIQGESGDGFASFETAPGLDWLSSDADADTIAAGATQTIDITFNATGLYGGLYEADLVFSSNDPINSEVTVPIGLEVTGASDIDVSVSELDFGEVFIGATYTDTIVVNNMGTDDLEVSGITSGNSLFTVDVSTFTLSPDDAREVIITYDPTTIGIDDTNLTIESNDTDEGTLIIPISAEVVETPSMVISPDTLGQGLFTGERETQILTISNEDGGSDLFWSLDFAYEGISGGVYEGHDASGEDNDGKVVNSRLDFPVPLAPGEFTELSESPDYLTALAIDRVSGIIYGQENNGNSFSQYDIETDTWTALTDAPTFSGNNGGAAYMDGKVYVVYTDNTSMGIYDISGDSWETISSPISTGNISSNGEFLYLISGYTLYKFDPADESFTALTSSPVNFQLWGGLSYYDGYLYGHSGNGSTSFAKYSIDDDSWNVLPSLPGGAVLGSAIDPVDEKYLAYGNYGGTNMYVYDIASESWESLSIPYFNVNDGGMVYGNSGVLSGIYFVQGESGNGFGMYETEVGLDWLSVDILADTIAAGTSQSVNVTFDAAGLAGGVYEASMLVSSNDPDNESTSIGIGLEVTGAPDIDLSASSVDFGSLFVGGTSSDTVLVRNIGTDDLEITSIASDDTDFTVSWTTSTIVAGESQELVINYSPSAVASDDANLTIESNDSDEGTLLLSLSGAGVTPPIVSITPDSLGQALDVGGTASQTLVISNEAGGADLTFELSIEPAANISVLEGSPVFKGDEKEVISSKSLDIEMSTAAEIYSSATLGAPEIAPTVTVVDLEYLTAVSDLLDEQFLSINGLIPNRFDFSDGETGNNISDGGNDMYDGGNYISTNLGTNISYTNGEITSSSALNEGLYMTKKYPGLFIFAGDASDISYLEITGNLGADGSGSADGQVISITKNGREYLGFVKRVYDAYDPSVNHLIIVENTGGLSHDFSTYTNNDFHQVNGLSANGPIFHLLYAGASGYYIDDDATTAIMNQFLNVISDAELNFLSISVESGVVSAGSTFDVTVDFDATSVNGGLYEASIIVSSNDPDDATVTVPVGLQVSGVPDISVAETSYFNGNFYIGGTHTDTLEITNTGTDDLLISSFAFSNEDYATDSSLVITAGSTESVFLTYSPTAFESDSSTLVITSNAASGSELTVNLNGSGVFGPEIASSTSGIANWSNEFEYSYSYFDIINTGDDQLTWSIGFQEAGSDVITSWLDWLYPSSYSGELDSGSVQDMSLTFDGTSFANGTAREATMFFFSNAVENDTLSVPITFNVDVIPEITVYSSTLYFGSVGVGDTSYQDLTIYNLGETDLNVTDIQFDMEEYFANQTAFTIGAGSTGIVRVNYTPGALNDFLGSMDIISDDPNKDTISVALEGYTFGYGEITSNVDTLDFGGVIVNSTISTELLLFNEGLGSLDVYDLWISGSSFSSSGWDVTITPGDTSRVYLSFTPTYEGEFSATIYLYNTDPDNNSYPVQLVGRGLSDAPQVVNDAELFIEHGVTDTLYLNDLFVDPQGNEMIFEVYSDEIISTYSYSGDTLIITGNQVGNEFYNLTAHNTQGRSTTWTATLNVQNASPFVENELDIISVMRGESLSINLYDVFADSNDPTTLVFSGEADAGISLGFNSSGVIIVGQEETTGEITLRATDPYDSIAELIVSFEVTPRVLSVTESLERIVYPNPTNGILYIDRLAAREVKSVEVVDFTGKKLDYKYDPNEGLIDIKGVSEGVYFLRLTLVNDELLIKKFVISLR